MIASSPVSSKSKEVIEVEGLGVLNRWSYISMTQNACGASSCMRLTLDGRKAVMTSLTFCVAAPGGGGGAPGVADPVAIVSVGSNLPIAGRHVL